MSISLFNKTSFWQVAGVYEPPIGHTFYSNSNNNNNNKYNNYIDTLILSNSKERDKPLSINIRAVSLKPGSVLNKIIARAFPP